MSVIASNGYNVVIGKTAFKALTTFLNKGSFSTCFILCDENTMQHCLPVLVASCPKLADAQIIEIESGEENKALELSANIWQTLLENKADGKALFINLGGGVVSDLGGFTASVYKRGISFINIPTSLLAMADASVGGKTGIDFGGIKNAVGTFSQPAAVFINPFFLNTLPVRHYRNGLAEVYKIALVSDKKFWTQLASRTQATEEDIVQSVALKNKIVLKDPLDKGRRRILNFGHSIGHALEALLLGTEHELLHGEAIVAGMMVESHIAFQKKMITAKQLSEVVSVFKSIFPLQAIDPQQFETIIELIRNDKKSTGAKLLFALIDGIGSCTFNVVVTEAQIKRSIRYYNSLLA